MLCKICVKILMRFFHTNFTFTIYFAEAADILEVILGKCIFEKSYINLGNNSVKEQKIQTNRKKFVRLTETIKKRADNSARFSYGDSYGTRTHVAAVRGQSLNRLTNEP